MTKHVTFKWALGDFTTVFRVTICSNGHVKRVGQIGFYFGLLDLYFTRSNGDALFMYNWAMILPDLVNCSFVINNSKLKLPVDLVYITDLYYF